MMHPERKFRGYKNLTEAITEASQGAKQTQYILLEMSKYHNQMPIGSSTLNFKVRRNEEHNIRCVTPLLDLPFNINTFKFSFCVVFADKRTESCHIKTSTVMSLLKGTRVCPCIFVLMYIAQKESI